MDTKLSNVVFFRRRSAGSNVVVPQTLQEASDGADTMTGSTETTMADSVRPLLSSMKLFGLYFRCVTETADDISNEKGRRRRRWNWCMIYGLVVVVFQWITVARMFSAFKNILLISCLLCLIDLSSAHVHIDL